MKAYIIRNKKKIEPFCKEASKLFVGNKRLDNLQKEILSVLNLTPVIVDDLSEINNDDEYIVFGEEVYFEPKLLREFINRSKKLHCKTVCALKRGIFTLKTVVKTQEIKKYKDRIEYNLYYYPEKNLRNQFKPIIFDLDQNLEGFFLPAHMQKNNNYLIPITERPIVQINHWSNLWSANLVSVLSKVARLRKTPKLKLLMIVLRKHSVNKWRIASSLNHIGKNCDIHPTAYIEGSFIGNNVVIGAGSCIRESIIGDNSFIGNDVTIESSVIGESCTILNGHVLYCVLYSGVFSVTHMISASIIGEDSFIGSGAVLTDFCFDNETVSVIKDDKKINTGCLFLGCCLGNGVYLGSNCVVAPGRTIPNNLHISLSKDRIITKIGQNNEWSGFRTNPQ